MRVLLLRFGLIAILVLALLPAAVMAANTIIDDSSHPEWITVEGPWTTGVSSIARYGDNYYYCNQSPGNGSSVTFRPNLGASELGWEVYIWYPAGMDRTAQAEVTVHHNDVDTVLHINQQQNGGMWVYLGTYDMASGTSNYVKIANDGVDVMKVVVADAVRFYTSGGDQQPPIISNVKSVAGSNSAVITWNTDEPATSQVMYGLTTGYGSESPSTPDPALVKDHMVSIIDLEPEKLYHFKVQSLDASGNTATSGDFTLNTGTTDEFPPLISELTIIPGATSAVVTWLTDEPATSLVEYGGATYGYTEQVAGLVTSHHVSIRDLTAQTFYHLRVKSADGADNMAVSDDKTFTTTATDTTPPVISNIAAEPDCYGALITWTTNEYATSQVEYGLTASYGNLTPDPEDPDLVVEHSVAISGLLPLTEYHYRVISADGSGNRAQSLDQTFTTDALDTTAPVISDVRATPGSRSCVITWTTDELATSKVLIMSPEGIPAVENSVLVIEHSVTVTGLTPNTTYTYGVISADGAGNERQEVGFEFTTKMADTSPPVITEIAVEVGSNSAVITWLTNEPATSEVRYGLTTAYELSATDDTLVTDHRVTLIGLDPSTTYYFMVRSRNAEGLEYAFTGLSFTTSGPDATPPVISEITVSRNMNSAIVRWLTNEPATSQVEYGTEITYGSETPLDTDLVTVHSVTLEGLLVDTLYHFRVKSMDGAGNLAVSGDHTFETSSTPPEYRMIWADTWHNGFLTADETTSFVNTVAAANYNAIVVEIRKSGDAYYDSEYEPWATNITPSGGDYDPLQDLINKAHAKGIEVHAWIVTYRAWYKTWPAAPEGHVYDLHGPDSTEDWSMRTSGGAYEEGNSLNIDPGVPGVQDYLANIVKDIVTKYPQVDGINFDYVRYPGTGWGYNDYTRQRFYYEYGYYPPTSSADPNWGVWCDYRRRQVTDLVRKCFVEAMYINPRIKMSADTIGWEGADPNTNYTGTSQYAGVFQDAKGWMDEGIIDVNILMNYKREFNAVQKDSYRRWADWLPRVASTTGRLAIDGQGDYLNSISASIAQMLYSRNAGSDGHCSYSYAVTNKDGQPAGDFFNSVRTNLYSAPAPIPDMPWKDQPTTGIIFGTITDAAEPDHAIYKNWVYQATVSISGPENHEAVTDATGTYAFLDLPPGVYTISVSKSGYEPKAFGGLSLAAGEVMRQDAAITSGLFTSPPGTVTAGWNLLSIPVQPADPDPATVFQGIDIEGYLYRWDKMTQSIIIYSAWNPEEFGDVNIDDGYWLLTTMPATISYEPADVAPQDVRTMALPRAGWYIIGCPFPGPKDWNAVTAAYGGYTETLATARDWNWLETLGYWWDNNGGNLYTYGLDDDWADKTVLEPWKGYWLQTHVNNLSITFH